MPIVQPGAAEVVSSGSGVNYFRTMRSSDLRHVTRMLIPQAIAVHTLRALQYFGGSGCEGLVLWLGSVQDDQAVVYQAFTPPQQAISSEDGVGYFVTSDTLFQLNRTLLQTGMRLIAQIHSHPGAAYHSPMDDRYAIVTEDGGVSLVVPDFGKAPVEPASWAAYRLHGATWKSLSLADAKSFLLLTEAE
jgi:hypothetical protein